MLLDGIFRPQLGRNLETLPDYTHNQLEQINTFWRRGRYSNQVLAVLQGRPQGNRYHSWGHLLAWRVLRLAFHSAPRLAAAAGAGDASGAGPFHPGGHLAGGFRRSPASRANEPSRVRAEPTSGGRKSGGQNPRNKTVKDMMWLVFFLFFV